MASEVAKKLFERRQNVYNEMKEVAERASDENRALNGEEESKWTALNAEIQAIDQRMKSQLEGEQRAKDIDSAFSKLDKQPRADGKPDGRTSTDVEGGDRSVALRAFATGKSGERYFDVTAEGPVDFRTLSKLTAGAGQNTVPTDFYHQLMAHLINTSALMQTGPTVLNTSGGETIQIPKTTAHSAAAIVTEGAAIAASDPAFGQVGLGAFKYGTLIQISRELISDSGVDLEGYMSMQAGRALGNAVGQHFISGTGTGQPRGVALDATTGVTVAAGLAGIPTPDNLIDLYYSVIPPYRNKDTAFWLMNDTTLAAIRKFKDGQGRYIWQPAYTAGVPDTILGKPVLTDFGMALNGINAKSIVFGDFSQYFIRLAGGVRWERSDDYAFNTDLVTFRALLRADGALVDLTGAVKALVGGAT